ncbi:hypothetical protein CU044_5380 [Streptomyces sp. L-9-10]|nr:hypothetical protein CU044_5380 [Streptomyces sp. L-9-10]
MGVQACSSDEYRTKRGGPCTAHPATAHRSVCGESRKVWTTRQ